MKKVLFALVAFAAIAASCAKVQEPAVIDQPAAPAIEGVEYSLNVVTTKTVADGYATKWVAGDQINVFNAPANGAYAPQGAFAIDEAGLADNTFTGVIEPLEADAYNWLAVYPYAEANTNLAALKLNIGAAAAALKTAPGFAGANIPLYGCAENVAKDDPFSIQMHHLASGIAFKVNNKDEEALAVSEITLTFPAAVAGPFTVNASDLDAITYAAAEGASATITLTAAEPISIAAGESAKFYAPLAPCTVAKDAKIAYTINGQEGEFVAAGNIVFKPGNISVISVAYETAGPSIPATDSPVLLNPGPQVTYVGPDLAPALNQNRFFQLEYWTHNNNTAPTVDAYPGQPTQIAIWVAHAWGCGDIINAKFYQTFKLLPGTYKFVTNTRHSTEDSWPLGAAVGRPQNFVNAWSVACLGTEINDLDAATWNAVPKTDGLLGSVDLSNNPGTGVAPKANAVEFTLTQTKVVSVGVVYSTFSWDFYQWMCSWNSDPNNQLPWMDLYINDFEFYNTSK